MSKKENVIRVEFCRGSSPSLDVHLTGEVQPVSLFRGIVELNSEKLSEKEIEAVIHIVTSKKRVMLKQRNFPQIYDELLTELIEVQRKRYEVKKDKKRRLGYGVSGGKLEEILGDYINIQDVHIDSIYVGSNRQSVERIDLESDDRYLVHLSFHEAIEDE
jgi:hypothetical protein